MKENNKYIMFHGSISEIASFTEEKIGKGGDPNSAMGIHATEIPSVAFEYASLQATLIRDQPILYVLEINFEKEDFIHSSEDFYGCYDEDTNHHDYFKEIRNEYLENEIDIVHFEGGEEPSSVIISPENISIIKSIKGKNNIQDFVKAFEENFISYDDYESRKKIVDNFKINDKKRGLKPK